LPTSNFQCNYIQQSVGECLEWLNHVSIQNMPVNNHFIDNYFIDSSTRLEAMQVSPQTMRALVYAIKHKQAIDTHYASLNHPKGEPRRIHPHTFVKTELRWYLRSYSEKRNDYCELLAAARTT
jgi:hypothetical protein